MGFERVEGGWRYNFGGMKTNAAADELPTTKYPYAKNVRMVKSLQTRPGYELLFATALDILTVCPLPIGEVGIVYTDTLLGDGGEPPYTWSISSGTLPGGLALVGATGVISGTPTTPETQNFVIRLTDSLGNTTTKNCSLHIYAPPVITTVCPLPDATKDSPYSETFAATGGAPPLVWTIISGALPTGLSMDTSGNVTGTPTVEEVGSFTVQVADALGGIDTLSCQITVQPACFNFSDDFNRANAPDLGANWSWITESSGVQAQVISNQLACSALGTAEVVAAPAANVNGYAEITLTAYGSQQCGGPMVLRATNGVNNNRYVFTFQNTGPGTNNSLAIFKVSGGAFTALVATGAVYQPNCSDLIGVPMKLTYVVQASKVVLTAYLNGVQLLTVDDSTGTRLTAGKPGYSCLASTSPGGASSWDTFDCHTCP